MCPIRGKFCQIFLLVFFGFGATHFAAQPAPGKSTGGWREGFAVGTLDLPAGDAGQSTHPECPPAKCGMLYVHGIPPGATIQLVVPAVGTVSNGKRRSGVYFPVKCSPIPLPSPSNPTQALEWGCDHYARFGGLTRSRLTRVAESNSKYYL